MKSAIGTILSTFGLCGLKIMRNGSMAIVESGLVDACVIDIWAYDYRCDEGGEILWRNQNLKMKSESFKRDIINIFNKYNVGLLEYNTGLHDKNEFIFHDINSEMWCDEIEQEYGSNQLELYLEIYVTPNALSKPGFMDDIKALIVDYFTMISGGDNVGFSEFRLLGQKILALPEYNNAMSKIELRKM